jgi:hypothetical protein
LLINWVSIDLPKLSFNSLTAEKKKKRENDQNQRKFFESVLTNGDGGKHEFVELDLVVA